MLIFGIFKAVAFNSLFLAASESSFVFAFFASFCSCVNFLGAGFFAFVLALRFLAAVFFSAAEVPVRGLAAAFLTERLTGRDGSPTTLFGRPGVA